VYALWTLVFNKAMNLPTNLKIGGHFVTVIEKELEDDNGSFDSATNTITICSAITQSQKEATLIHEILHACNTTLGGGDFGHAFLDSFSEQIYQVLKDNADIQWKK